MGKVPVLNYRIMHRTLLNLGFIKVRQKGSHVFYRHRDGRTTTVPNHKDQDLAKPLIRAIINEIEVTLDDFIKMMKNV